LTEYFLALRYFCCAHALKWFVKRYICAHM
jgi:hypothetical protein